MADAKWVTLEGGDTETFPLSINQATYWTGLKRGECSFQENTRYNLEGILSYATAPAVSSSFRALEFVDPTKDEASVREGQTRRFWAYGRWWRIGWEYGYRLEYTEFGQESSSSFDVAGYETFNEDGSDTIAMIATDGEGTWFVLKPKCAYRLLNANGDSSGFRKTAAYYGMGCSNPGKFVSNAIIGGNVVAAWDALATGADQGMRHYIWNGGDGAVELSRNVRGLAKQQDADRRCGINWAENLVICYNMVYDLDNKRVYYYDQTHTNASITTRSYHHAKYHPSIIRSLAFIHDGKEGSFTVTIEGGQVEDTPAFREVYNVVINKQNKNNFRFELQLNRVLRAVAWRLKITGLVGCGITQIDALVSYDDSPNAWVEP